MKKLMKILACMGCVLMLVGCKKALDNEPLTINTSIDGSATIEANGREYKAKIFSSPEGISSITFTYPESISGLSFSCKDGKCEISRKNLVGTFSPQPLEGDSFTRIILDFLSEVNNTEIFRFVENQEDVRVYEGKFSDKNLKVFASPEGKILSVEVPEENITINFE